MESRIHQSIRTKPRSRQCDSSDQETPTNCTLAFHSASFRELKALCIIKRHLALTRTQSILNFLPQFCLLFPNMLTLPVREKTRCDGVASPPWEGRQPLHAAKLREHAIKSGLPSRQRSQSGDLPSQRGTRIIKAFSPTSLS